MNKFIGIVSFWLWIQNFIKVTVQNIIWPNERFDPNYRFRTLTCDIYHNVIFSYKFIDRILSYTDEKDFKFYGMSMISNVWPSVNDQTWFLSKIWSTIRWHNVHYHSFVRKDNQNNCTWRKTTVNISNLLKETL